VRRALPFSALLAVSLLNMIPALAQTPAVVSPPDSRRTYARITREWGEVAVWAERLDDRTAADEDATAYWAQLGVGPVRYQLPLRGATLGWLARWAYRARFGVIHPDGGEYIAGPLTVAAMRFTPHDSFDVERMLHLESGLEIALSTPWLEDPDGLPPSSVRELHGPDAEVADVGWSLRPATLHGRIDLLSCRSWHVELGAGPEIFRSTIDEARPLDYGLRWHIVGGVVPICPRSYFTFLRQVTISVQHRARAMLYNAERDPFYAGTNAFGIAYSRKHFSASIQVASADWDWFWAWDNWSVGLRLALMGGGL
jgi:hypothetical protein